MTAGVVIDRRKFRRLHGKGWGTMRLAAHFHASPATIRSIRRKLGLPSNAVRLTADQEANLALAHQLYQAEHGRLTLTEAAKRYGMTGHQLSHWRQRLRSPDGDQGVKAAAAEACEKMRGETEAEIRAWTQRREARLQADPWLDVRAP